MSAWTAEDEKKPWGCEVAFLRHLAADPALNQEQVMMLRHCAKRIESTAAQPAAAGVPGKYDDVLTPFVAMMRAELHANAGKGDRPGWLAMSAETCLLEIYYHLAKLQKAVRRDSGNAICEYAADVANMSMMLVDICGGLAAAPQPEPAGSEAVGIVGERGSVSWRSETILPIGTKLYTSATGGAEAEALELLRRCVPFLRDEAAKYDDDGSNEPLELTREIETITGAPDHG